MLAKLNTDKGITVHKDQESSKKETKKLEEFGFVELLTFPSPF